MPLPGCLLDCCESLLPWPLPCCAFSEFLASWPSSPSCASPCCWPFCCWPSLPFCLEPCCDLLCAGFLVLALLRLALLVLLGLGFGEQILEGVLHLAHQAGTFAGVLGVLLLAVLLLVVLAAFAVALLAVLALFAVLAGGAFALRIGIVGGHFVVALLARFLAGERLGVHLGDGFRFGLRRGLSFLVGLLLAGIFLILIWRRRCRRRAFRESAWDCAARSSPAGRACRR